MDAQHIEFTVESAGQRLDKCVVASVGDRLSRSQIQAMIRDGLVTVDGEQVKPGIRLKGGEHIAITVPHREEGVGVQPESIPLIVLYEDADLAVIDKPAGMTVHPGVGDEKGTLVAATLARWPDVAHMNIEAKRAGIVHRLDKDTSGLILIARNDLTRRKLMAQFQARSVEKTYIAVLERSPQTRTGRIDAPIGRDSNRRKRMAVVRGGRAAITEFEVIDGDFPGGQVLVRVKPLTGRTHQIRVHMAFIDCPIVGDTVYGYRKQRVPLKRHFLHAARLCFDHPASGERLCFDSPLPPELQSVIDHLRT